MIGNFNIEALPRGSCHITTTANGVEPAMTVQEFEVMHNCSNKTALDRFNQVEYFFTLIGQPEKVLKFGRKRVLPISSVTEFLVATEGYWFPLGHWREDIMELARSIQKSEMKGQEDE